MNENLNLIKILEGCPNGTKLYSPFIGDVKFSSISGKYIYVSTMYGNLEAFDKKGIYGHYDGECMLLPSKDQRDWSKFERFWDKPKKDKFNVNTLQGNNMNNIEKLKRISTPAEENWFKIAEEWEREDKEEE